MDAEKQVGRNALPYRQTLDKIRKALPWKKKTEIYLSRKSDNRNALNENEAKMPLRTTFFTMRCIALRNATKTIFCPTF